MLRRSAVRCTPIVSPVLPPSARITFEGSILKATDFPSRKCAAFRPAPAHRTGLSYTGSDLQTVLVILTGSGLSGPTAALYVQRSTRLIICPVPQFEVEDPAAHAEVSRIRARSAEEAVRGWLGLTADTAVHLEKATAALDELEGWREIWIDGARRGRIRPFQRMRFRRD